MSLKKAILILLFLSLQTGLRSYSFADTSLTRNTPGTFFSINNAFKNFDYANSPNDLDINLKCIASYDKNHVFVALRNLYKSINPFSKNLHQISRNRIERKERYFKLDLEKISQSQFIFQIKNETKSIININFPTFIHTGHSECKFLGNYNSVLFFDSDKSCREISDQLKEGFLNCNDVPEKLGEGYSNIILSRRIKVDDYFISSADRIVSFSRNKDLFTKDFFIADLICPEVRCTDSGLMEIIFQSKLMNATHQYEHEDYGREQ